MRAGWKPTPLACSGGVHGVGWRFMVSWADPAGGSYSDRKCRNSRAELKLRGQARRPVLQDGAGTGGDVAVFPAFDLLRGFPYRGDGGVVDVRVLEEDFHDGVVVNGPDFKVRWDVRGIAGFDEVDLVRSIFMIAAGAGVRGVSLIGQQGVAVGVLI